MPPLRIAIAALPQLLRDIVATALSSEPDMVLVGEASGSDELSGLVESSRPDLAIVACERSEVERLGRVVNGSPVTLLAIVDGGRHGALYELRPAEVDLGELSPSLLVDAIREVAQRSVI